MACKKCGEWPGSVVRKPLAMGCLGESNSSLVAKSLADSGGPWDGVQEVWRVAWGCGVKAPCHGVPRFKKFHPGSKSPWQTVEGPE